MAIASRLGPWLIGTVRETIGSSTTLGQVRNMGVTDVVQNKTIAFGDAAASVACVIPAGSLIRAVQLLPTTAFTSGTTSTIQIFVNSSAISAATTTSTGTTTLISIPIGTSNPALVANVGTSDVSITYTQALATAGAGVLIVSYMVRNPDGTYGVNA